MADRKVSQLSTLTTPDGEDLLLIIDDPNGVPSSKKVTLKILFGAVPANTVILGLFKSQGNSIFHCSNTTFSSNVNVTGITSVNNFVFTSKTNPSSNNAATAGLRPGQMFWSNTYLYLAVNATTIKRVALTTF